LGDKSRQQSGAVPEWIEAGRFVLAQELKSDGQGRLLFVSVKILRLLPQSAGTAGFFARARPGGQSLNAATQIYIKGPGHTHIGTNRKLCSMAWSIGFALF